MQVEKNQYWRNKTTNKECVVLAVSSNVIRFYELNTPEGSWTTELKERFKQCFYRIDPSEAGELESYDSGNEVGQSGAKTDTQDAHGLPFLNILYRCKNRQYEDCTPTEFNLAYTMVKCEFSKGVPVWYKTNDFIEDYFLAPEENDLKGGSCEIAASENPEQGRVAKYMLLNCTRNGIENLEKAKHYIDLLIEIRDLENGK